MPCKSTSSLPGSIQQGACATSRRSMLGSFDDRCTCTHAFMQESGCLPYRVLHLRLVSCPAPFVSFAYKAGGGACGVGRRRWRPCYCLCRGSLLDRGRWWLTRCRLGYEPSCTSPLCDHCVLLKKWQNATHPLFNLTVTHTEGIMAHFYKQTVPRRPPKPSH